MKSVELIMKPL